MNWVSRFTSNSTKKLRRSVSSFSIFGEIKEIEVTGEKPEESASDMKKQKKLQRRKSIDKEELNFSCRALGKADHEGWLYKKAGGHGIVPVSWKKFWVIIKLGK